jgi:hypothetical protein
MKKKTKQMIGVVLLIAVPFIVSCEPEPKIVEVEKDIYHDYFGTIYAFGGAIDVKSAHGGNPQAITVAQFKTALGKLQQAMSMLDAYYTSPDGAFINMLSRDGFAIIIGIGDAGPAADINKSMTIGIGYLIENNNNIDQIADDIEDKVIFEKVFANANNKSNVRMAGATPRLNKQEIVFNNRLTVYNFIKYKCYKFNKMVIVSATVV